MFPYEFYKFLHYLMIFIFVAGLGVSFFTVNNPKWNKILTGVSSVLIFVAGMGLLARIGVQHGKGFPGWIWAKMVIWFLLAIGAPVLAKRAGQYKVVAYFALLSVTSLAAWFAVYKPFDF